MQELVETQEERRRAHQVLQDFEERNGVESHRAMSVLLGLETEE